ncbi:MAG: glycosyltransferase family 2 protein [Endomicrobiia bacterium]
MNGKNIKNNGTVCAVVVTYNRKDLLLKCLETIRKQTRSVDAIYLIDNASTDGTPQLLKEKGYILDIPPENLKEPWEKESKIKIDSIIDGKPISFYYVRMNKNMGGAGGFHEGLKRAYEKGYSWFWLMDDDCEPTSECLNNIFQSFKYLKINCPENNLWGPIVVDKKNGKSFWHQKEIELNPNENIIEVSSIAFNGLLVNKNLVDRIGNIDKELILYGDDREFSLRARRNGAKCYVCRSSILYHPVNYQVRFFKLFNKTLFWCEINFSRKGRLYLIVRNSIYIFLKYINFFSLKDIYYFLLYLAITGILQLINFRIYTVIEVSKGMIDSIKMLFRKTSKKK